MGFPTVDREFQWLIGDPAQSRPAASGYAHKTIFIRRDSAGRFLDIAQVVDDGASGKTWHLWLEGHDWGAGVFASRPATPLSSSGDTIDPYLWFASDTKETWLFYSGSWIKLSGGASGGTALIAKHNLSTTVPQLADPTTAPTAVLGAAGLLTGNFEWGYTWVGDYGETAVSALSASLGLAAAQADLSGIAYGGVR